MHPVVTGAESAWASVPFFTMAIDAPQNYTALPCRGCKEKKLQQNIRHIETSVKPCFSFTLLSHLLLSFIRAVDKVKEGRERDGEEDRKKGRSPGHGRIYTQ